MDDEELKINSYTARPTIVKETSISRRRFLRQAAFTGIAFASCPSNLFAALPSHLPVPKLYGLNAYFLLVEAYCKVIKAPGKNIKEVLKCYLRDEIKLSLIQDKSRINAVRFWAFNDYPAPCAPFPPYVFDGKLWIDASRPDSTVLEVLHCLVELLSEMNLTLVPVLSNFWPSYGGILQYLVWTGELEEETYIQALCSPVLESRIYLRNCLKFFTSPAVASLYHTHLSRVLPLLCQTRQVRIIEIMNEPRGKNPRSLRGKVLKDGRMPSDVVAGWLNRQARWIKSFIKEKGLVVPYLSTGEEGWLEKPLTTKTVYLKGQGQYYEAIDLVKNTHYSPKGVTIGTIHMYPHPVVKMFNKNICGVRFLERRGWGFLLKDNLTATVKNYRGLAREWITTRASLLKGRPWYLGEMGWCWPGTSIGSGVADQKTLFKQRKTLYSEWLSLTFEKGGMGAFIWMLNGLQHKDPFYGLSPSNIISLMSGI
jgi:mannan endo-1,4-beta-mannosidase